MADTNNLKVFISYSHDTDQHKNKVLELSDRLRDEGIDCKIDQYVDSPAKGWLQWMEDQIEDADYVLIVCTETYHNRFRMKVEAGKGATWEGAIINQIIYDNFSKNTKFIPVIMVKNDSEHIPTILRKDTYYNLSSEDGYTDLYRKLTDQPFIVKPALGSIKSLSKRERKQEFAQIGNDTSSTPIHNLPQRNLYYTGREEYLAQIKEALKNNEQAAITQTKAISGLGGIGKTQTAVEYAYRHQEEFSHIFWVVAETEQDLISGFSELAQLLDLPQKDAQDQIKIVQAVLQWMQRHDRWLLILDNVDDFSVVAPFIPATDHGQRLITTRITDLDQNATMIPVEKMSDEEGAVLLLRRTNIITPKQHLHDAPDADQASALKLSHELDGLPLALDQAAAFINETKCNTARYLDIYKTEGAQLLQRRGKYAQDHKDPVTTTFLLSFEKVEEANPAAADLIRACAFLAADEIPEELFTDAAKHWGEHISGIEGDLDYEDMVAAAIQFHLIKRDPETDTFNIHRLVQEVIRAEMDDNTQRGWAERTVKALNAIYPDPDFENWELCERLTPQFQEIVRWIEKWTIEIKESGRLFTQISAYFWRRARNSDAELFNRKAITINEKVYGTEQIVVASCYNNLAILLGDQNKFDEAETLFRKAISFGGNTLGDEHPEVAVWYNNLANLLGDQGQFDEAETLCRKAIAIGENTLGDEHPQLANRYNNLAGLLFEQNKFEEADTLFEKSLKIRKQTIGEEHPDYANSLWWVAHVNYKKENYERAEPYFIQAINIFEKTIGTEHPTYALIISQYADLLRDTNRPDEANELKAQARDIRARHAEMNKQADGE